MALLLERSFDLVTAMLATVLAGAAYVPLDPTYPRARIAELLHGAAPVLVVSHRQLAAGLARDLVESHRRQAAAGEAAPCELIDLDQAAAPPRAAAGRLLAGQPSPAARLRHLHLGVHRHAEGSRGGATARWRITWPGCSSVSPRPGDRVRLEKTGVTFDASVWELWAPLTGTPLVLARPGLHADPRYLVEALAEQGISTLQMVPSVLELLVEAPGLEACTALRQVFVGGEALTSAAGAAAAPPACRRGRQPLRSGRDDRGRHLCGPAARAGDSGDAGVHATCRCRRGAGASGLDRRSDRQPARPRPRPGAWSPSWRGSGRILYLAGAGLGARLSPPPRR